ncbi:fibrobacter succinogenes major paralogous domain-containing protein [Dysgonomonas sp. GY617]|uniref:fibrobacter succinogenes major paralogous domain-containing protein n=1 Tax=Dysgonomonas sp. GY617 TaxID=2780420 RepID=UPI001883A6D8|nr:fibrobacter succinogenes major paralogous domain-containing protein [Dysgonomonas sp. GY617]MBF0574495.1 fibrobacter succinogenes major paralogous domain-containing protein [Dysgonomonas sp. GY617]
MNINYLAKLSFFCLFALGSNLYAQVTIGSHLSAASGALLEIKEKDITGGDLATSTRGLMMPRVALTSLNDLFPMLTGNESDYAAQKIIHIGLIVYNTNVCAPAPLGLNVWNGSQWQYLGNEQLGSNVRVFYDQDGNAFKAANFGTAGVWMTENLAAKTYASSMGGDAIPLHTGTSDNDLVAYAYPNGTPGNWGALPLNWNTNQGLVYSWFAAAKGNANTAVDQQVIGSAVEAFEVEMIGPLGVAPNKYVQGICPDGWHLPSDREWNQLEQEIYNNASSYSASVTSTFNPTSWVIAWGGEPTRTVYMNVFRGSTSTSGHATAMKSICPPAGSSTETNGTSISSAKGGFNVLLTGGVYGAALLGFGTRGYFWTSSSGSQNATAYVSVYRGVSPTNAGVIRGNTNRAYLWAVRCKKNTDSL